MDKKLFFYDTPLSRRMFLKKILFSSSLLILPSTSLLNCSRKEEKSNIKYNNKTLNLFNWRYYIGKSTISNFEKEFGVRVNIDYYASNEEALSKLRSSSVPYDIVIPSDYMIKIMINEKLIQKINKKKITNLKNIDEHFLNLDFDKNNNYSIPYMWGSTGFAINRKYVHEDINNWDKFFNPKYKGKISVLDDIRFTLGSILLDKGYDPNTTNIEQLNEVKSFLINHKNLIRSFTQDSPKEMLITGDYYLSYAWSGDILQASIENPALEYILPEKGTLIFQDGLCIPSKSSNVELAHEFINFILRPDISAEITNSIYYGNPNLPARQLINPVILNNKSIFPEKEYLDRCKRIHDVGSFMVEYEKVWEEIKAS